MNQSHPAKLKRTLNPIWRNFHASTLSFLILVVAFLLTTSFHSLWSQTPAGEQEHICHYEVDSLLPNMRSNGYAPYGSHFTPKGELRSLIVFVAFKGYTEFGFEPWKAFDPENPNPNEDNNGLPTIIDDGYSSDYNFHFDGDGFLFRNVSDFNNSAYMQDHNYAGISKMLYQISDSCDPFLFTAETFTNSMGIPVLVIIDPDDYKGLQWRGINKLVVEKMKEINPGFDLSPFDQRENSPRYNFDNSQTQPDGVVDNVIFYYRYSADTSLSSPWRSLNLDVIQNMYKWSGSRGGYWGGSGVGNESIGSIDFPFSSFTICSGGGDKRGLFLHELGHAWFNAPHTAGANSVSGPRFCVPTCGISSTGNSIPMTQPMLNAWERWYVGFIEPEEVDDSQSEVIVTLRDYINSGDAARVKIPFSDRDGQVQHLWISNHTGDNAFDVHRWEGRNPGPGSHILPNNGYGLFMMVEDIAPGRNFVNLFGPGANGFKFLNASGNYDFEWDRDEPYIVNYWGNRLYLMERGKENPVSGNHPWMRLREDIEQTGTIKFDANHNNPNASYPDNEGHPILREIVNGNDEITYRGFGVYDPGLEAHLRNPFFQEGDLLQLGENPFVLNYPKYSNNSYTSYYLNGLSIEIISIDDTHAPGHNDYRKATVKISFKQTALDKNTRLTGNIVLPDITGDSEADLIIGAGKTLTLDLSGTNERQTLHPESGGFVNPTAFRVDEDAELRMKNAATLDVKEYSSLILSENSSLYLEGNGGVVDVHETAKLVIEGGSIWLGEGSEIRIRGDLIIEDNTDFSFDGPGQVIFYPSHNLVLGQNSGFKINRDPAYEENNMITLLHGTTLNFGAHELNLSNGKVIFIENSEINFSSGGEVNINNVHFTSDDQNTNLGITGNAFNNFFINNSLFTNFSHGIRVNSSLAQILIYNTGFENNRTGIHAEASPRLYIYNSTFKNNTIEAVGASSLDEFTFRSSTVSNGGNVGLSVSRVPFAIVDASEIKQCYYGIRATQSNVFLRNCTRILQNNTGVNYYGNTEADFALTVGDFGKASIVGNSTYGVEGNNIILNIDVPTHHGTYHPLFNNYSNDFFNNGQANFKICYTDPAYIAYNILMRGNNWNSSSGPPSGSIQFTYSNCQIQNPYTVQPFATTAIICTQLEYPDEIQPELYSGPLPNVQNEKWYNQTTQQLFDSFHQGYEELLDSNYLTGQQLLETVSAFRLDTTLPNYFRHISNIAYALVKYNDSSIGYPGFEQRIASPGNQQKEKISEVVVAYPNPSSSRVHLLNKDQESAYHLEFYSSEGKHLGRQMLPPAGETIWQKTLPGIYLIRIISPETGNLIQEIKQIIH
ncbi:MAG: hypothetical protein EA409_07315 [Saprospirales bacterium]|nr:MAG: hypothetical protein EA409_07315 [Saprospirales bacterium]